MKASNTFIMTGIVLNATLQKPDVSVTGLGHLILMQLRVVHEVLPSENQPHVLLILSLCSLSLTHKIMVKGTLQDLI